MSRFLQAPKLDFSRPVTTDAPKAVCVHATRRQIKIKEASTLLDSLPAVGESVHCLMTGRYDLMHVLVALVPRLGGLKSLTVATLSYNGRNLQEMFALLDGGAVDKLTLLCSTFFRDHNKELWEEAKEGFRERGQACAAVRSHCKVVCVEARTGRKLVMEGSANLRSNGNWEQLAIVADDSLAAWHETWIQERVASYVDEIDQG